MSDAEEEVLAANAAFYAAFNDRDVRAMDALWARNVEVTCVHPSWNVLSGREAVMESWRAILGNPSQPSLMGVAEQARVQGEVAVVVGRELVAGSPITVTNMFVREGEAWKMMHHHASAVMLTD